MQTAANAATEESPSATRAVATAGAVAGLLVSLAFAWSLLDALVDSRRFPFAGAWVDPLPLLALGGFALVLVAGLVRKSGAVGLFGGVLAVAAGVHGAADLPPFGANAWFADGPEGAWYLLGAGILVGLFAAAGPRSWRSDERLAAVLLVLATGSANLFSRDGEGIFVLLGAGVLVHLVAAPPVGPLARPFARAMAPLTVVALVFVVWVWLGVANGQDTNLGYRVGLRVVLGWLLFCTLGRGLDREGAKRMVAALLGGAALAFGAVALDLVAVAALEGWPRVLGSRLRGLGMHPNGVGPLFASTAVLGAGAALAFRGAARWGSGLLAVLAFVALERTDSRASLLGLAVGAAVLLAALWLRAPRKARTAPLAVGAAAVVFGAVLWSPLGTMLVTRLDGLAWGQSAIGQRWHFWRTSLAALQEHPWFGLGPNQYFQRARFAEPSFYDGTAQDLHPHQIFLAIAEGAGWPALALFVGLLVLLFELARRSLLRTNAGPNETRPGEAGAESLAARAVPAGLLAYAATILGANQLDLGLSQNTYAPLWLWIALGLLAAAGTESVSGPWRTSQRGLAVAAALAALPLVLHPALCCAAAARAQSAFYGGRAQLAHRESERLELLSPGDSRAFVIQVRAAQALGRPAEVLALRMQRAERSPARAGSWHALAQEALSQGQLPLAREAVVRARTLDPRGLRVGDALHLEAALGFAAGDMEGAKALLFEAMELGSRALDAVPFATLPPEASDPPGARRRAFQVRGSDGAPQLVPWTDFLEEVGAEVVALATGDPVRSRRLLHPLLTAYASMGLHGEALLWSQRHREASDARFPSVAALEIELLGRVGRWDEALELVEAGGRDPTLRLGLARAELVAATPEMDSHSRAELEHDLARLDAMDLFFNAGQTTALLDRANQLLTARGEWSAARLSLLRVLREVEDAPQRQRLALAFLRAVEAAPAPLEERAKALAIYGAQWRLTPRALLGAGAVAERARTYWRAGQEPAAEKWAAARDALLARGYAERLLLAEIEALGAR